MKYERPTVLATYKVVELMKDAAVCTVYCRENQQHPFQRFFGR
jgi:hypothetical protein